MRVLIAGATGSIGKPLVDALLAQGNTVVVLGRSKQKIVETFGESVTPETWEELADESLLDLDAVVNLAGENVGGVMRWSSEYMQNILDSRVQTTSRLAQRLKQSGSVARLVNASGISIYGHQDYDDQDVKDEDSPVPETHPDFLTDVTIQWEAAAKNAVPEHQLVLLRFGIVLCPGGGALGKMELPFKMGLGGRLGPGTQAMSWISLEDAVRALCFILSHREINGPVNIVAGFVPQLQFAESLASALNRPCLLPAPSFALRLVLGADMAQNLVLVNHRIKAKRLRDAGFEFNDTDLGAVMTKMYQST